MDYPKNLELSVHAFERMQERFPNYSKNKKAATDYIRSLMKQTSYIGLVPDKHGSDSHMYVYNKSIAIHIAQDSGLVTTVYNIDRDNREYIGFRDKVSDLYKKEFRKIHRLELTKRKKNVFSKAKNEAEIAALKYKSLITRSQNVKNDCERRIAELKNEILLEESEVKGLQDLKRNVAYAIATENF